MLLFFILILVAVICSLSWYLDSRRQVEFRKKFPPLTEDEFVERCGPGTDREVALKVRDIIATQLHIPPAEIYPEHRFIDDLHAD